MLEDFFHLLQQHFWSCRKAKEYCCSCTLFFLFWDISGIGCAAIWGYSCRKWGIDVFTWICLCWFKRGTNMWFQTVDELRGCSRDKEELILGCESCKDTLVVCKNRNIQSWKLAQYVSEIKVCRCCRWFKSCQLCSNCACSERKQIKPHA